LQVISKTKSAGPERIRRPALYPSELIAPMTDIRQRTGHRNASYYVRNE
jgi:hypothetical protein